MSNDLTIRPNAGVEICGIIISSMAEMLSTCDMLAKSDFVPVAYRGKPGNILACVQFGREIGLSPMQALQGIAVVNGKPSVYGTTYLAVCHNAPGFRDVVQSVEKDAAGKLVATCTAKRTGRADVTRVFTQDMAIKAGLWNKNVHASYPETMLLWRATHLACDTMFADVLKGMPIRENAEVDYDEPKAEPVGATASERLANQLKGSVTIFSMEDAAEQASTSSVEATKGQNAANDTQKTPTQATPSRGAALWARWQARPELPQTIKGDRTANEIVNTTLVSITGDKLATVKLFAKGSNEQLDAIESFLDAVEQEGPVESDPETDDSDPYEGEETDIGDEAPLLEMAAPDTDSKATIGAMSR